MFLFRGKKDAKKEKQKPERAASVSSKADQVADPTSPTSPVSAERPEYRAPKKMLTKPIEVLNEILYRDQGTVMDRIAPGRKPQEVCVWFNPKTFLISWFAGSSKGRPGTHIGQVDVSEVKEVRSGAQAVNTKDFKAGIDAPESREKYALCILYGTEFRLKQLCFYTRRDDELLAWTRG